MNEIGQNEEILNENDM